MRSKTIEYIYTKQILDIADSGYLTVDTTTSYSANDYYHDGVITFSTIFPELIDSWISVKTIKIIEELRGTGSLIKPTGILYLFPQIKTSPTVSKNNPFRYSDIFDSGYPVENFFHKITITASDWNYEYNDTSNNIYDALAIVFPSNIYLKTSGTQNLFGVFVTNTTTNPFSAGIKLKIQLVCELL